MTVEKFSGRHAQWATVKGADMPNSASNGEVASPRLGFIGLGQMGRPIARRLLQAGFPVTVCDIDAAAVAELRSVGADAATSPRALASQADVIVACLPSSRVSEAVAYGPDGVVNGSPGRLYIELSTIGQPTMRRIDEALGARGIGVLDAPVSGGVQAASAGALACMVAGSRDRFDQAGPVLRAFAGKVFHVGAAPGLSQILKLANNMLFAANLAVASEMVAMAARAGIDPGVAIDVINASSGRNFATENAFRGRILDNKFETGANVDILCKDVELALAEIVAAALPHIASSGVRDAWQAAVAAGLGPRDITEIYKFIAS
jgi:3-hydroxyisobutyrate dehydrogenase-like beta-hydroxyacid dehydrogenase